MKYPILIILLASVMLVAKAQDNTINKEKDLARVNAYQGILIFTDSKPLLEYEYIATVKKVNWSGVYDKLINGVIKNAKEECPGLEALIIHWKPNGTVQADCIRFK